MSVRCFSLTYIYLSIILLDYAIRLVRFAVQRLTHLLTTNVYTHRRDRARARVLDTI